MKSYLLNIALGLTILASIFACNESLSETDALLEKKEQIQLLIDRFELNGSVQLSEDFNYDMSLEEIEATLQQFASMEQEHEAKMRQEKAIVTQLENTNDPLEIEQLKAQLNQLWSGSEDAITVEEQEQLLAQEQLLQERVKAYAEALATATSEAKRIEIAKLHQFTLPQDNDSYFMVHSITQEVHAID